MNNAYIESIKEFRRFVNTYIYPETSQIIISYITEQCNPINIEYESTPQALIKFNTNIINHPEYTYNIYTCNMHEKLKNIFIEYFSNPAISSLVKNKIHTEIQDENLKGVLRSTLSEIQYGNPHLLSLLFNITPLRDQCIYLYL